MRCNPEASVLEMKKLLRTMLKTVLYIQVIVTKPALAPFGPPDRPQWSFRLR